MDIREDSSAELLEFVMENGIDITLPISKKAIRKMLKENLDIARTGKKLLVEKTQLELFLRNEI